MIDSVFNLHFHQSLQTDNYQLLKYVETLNNGDSKTVDQVFSDMEKILRHKQSPPKSKFTILIVLSSYQLIKHILLSGNLQLTQFIKNRLLAQIRKIALYKYYQKSQVRGHDYFSFKEEFKKNKKEKKTLQQLGINFIRFSLEIIMVCSQFIPHDLLQNHQVSLFRQSYQSLKSYNIQYPDKLKFFSQKDLGQLQEKFKPIIKQKIPVKKQQNVEIIIAEMESLKYKVIRSFSQQSNPDFLELKGLAQEIGRFISNISISFLPNLQKQSSLEERETYLKLHLFLNQFFIEYSNFKSEVISYDELRQRILPRYKQSTRQERVKINDCIVNKENKMMEQNFFEKKADSLKNQNYECQEQGQIKKIKYFNLEKIETSFKKRELKERQIINQVNIVKKCSKCNQYQQLIKELKIQLTKAIAISENQKNQKIKLGEYKLTQCLQSLRLLENEKNKLEEQLKNKQYIISQLERKLNRQKIIIQNVYYQKQNINKQFSKLKKFNKSPSIQKNYTEDRPSQLNKFKSEIDFEKKNISNKSIHSNKSHNLLIAKLKKSNSTYKSHSKINSLLQKDFKLPINLMEKQIDRKQNNLWKKFQPYYCAYSELEKIQFKKSCFKNKSLLFKNQMIEIGFISQLQKHYILKFNLYFNSTTSNQLLIKPSLIIKGQLESLNQTNQFVLNSNEQQIIQLKLKLNKLPFQYIVLKLQMICGNKQKSIILLLPITWIKYLYPVKDMQVKGKQIRKDYIVNNGLHLKNLLIPPLFYLFDYYSFEHQILNERGRIILKGSNLVQILAQQLIFLLGK